MWEMHDGRLREEWWWGQMAITYRVVSSEQTTLSSFTIIGPLVSKKPKLKPCFLFEVALSFIGLSYT